jgi:hypothetical protein
MQKTPCRTARAVKADDFNPIEIGLRYCPDLNMIPRITPEGMLFGKLDSTFPDHALQRFPFILDHSVIEDERETPSIPLLAHVLVGEPDSTSPGHALGCPFQRPDPGHNETVY